MTQDTTEGIVYIDHDLHLTAIAPFLRIAHILYIHVCIGNHSRMFQFIPFFPELMFISRMFCVFALSKS